MEEQKKKAEKKKFNTKKLWLLVILISIILVPAFYGFTYLKSYWNNQESINQVPIAVVNEDTPYTKDGKIFDVGNTVVDNLKTNTTLDWNFVNYKEAEDGLYGSKYYAMIVIPKNFSEEIANATTDGFKKPQIDFYQNEGKNYVFSKISGVGAEKVKQSVAESISKSVSAVLVDTIYKTKDGFKTAADGADKLEDGVNKLSDGSSSLVSGMTKLQGGSSQLVGGVDKLQGGSQQLVDGVNKLQGGSSQLVGGVSKLQDGSKQLVGGVNKLQGGSQQLVNGVDKLQNGSEGLVAGMQKLSIGSENLEAGAQKLQGGSQQLASGMQKLKTGASQVAQGQAGISKAINAVQALLAQGKTKEANELLAQISEKNKQLQQGISALSSGIDNASQGANELNGGMNTLTDGIGSLHNGINQAKNGTMELNGGISSLGVGATTLNNGLGKVSEGANVLNGGLGQVAQGANALNSGLNSAKTGASALNNGLETVGSGVKTLNNGLQTAGSGAEKLNSGLDAAKTGVSKLSNGLNDGYDNLNKNITFTSGEMSDFIANPIILNTVIINPVSTYGEGFAPYFMCIGLWVGVMYVYFVISAMSRKFEGSFLKRFTKMYIMGVILSILQGLVLTTVVYYGLGMKAVSLGWLYGVVIISAIAIFSLMNGLHYIITPIMKGALVVIMVLQFTGCGGSYPVLAMPTFYQVIHPFLILSYSVDSLRMAISGMNYSLFYQYIGILVIFIIASVAVGYLVGYIRNYITHKRVLKERSELIDEKEAFNQYV